MRFLCCTVIPLLGVLIALAASAAEKARAFVFPDGRHGGGELRQLAGLPVLTVQGTPEEMGGQHGVLAGRPGGRVTQYPRDLLRRFGAEWTWNTLVAAGRSMLAQFPPHHRAELDALIRHSGVDPELCIAGNTLFDIKKLFACSSILVGADRSTDGRILFGRNLDFQSLDYLHEYTLVTVYRPKDKHAFASIGFPCLVGVLSGMNDSGLALAVHEAYLGADDSAQLNPKGVPYALLARLVLEECATIEEAAELFRRHPRTTHLNIPIADVRSVAVLEITAQNVVIRPASEGVAYCTNHFLSDKLRVLGQRNTFETLDRYRALGLGAKTPRLDVTDVKAALHSANLGRLTLQTMLFEPQSRTLHLAYGGLPASAEPLRKLELAELFTGNGVPKAAK